MGLAVVREDMTMNDDNGNHAATPGPWYCDDTLDLIPGGSIAVTNAPTDAPSRIVIAEIWKADDAFAGKATDEPISKANARLIAAAPELLEALKDMVSNSHDLIALAWDVAPKDVREWDKESLRKARAAIAKAKGD